MNELLPQAFKSVSLRFIRMYER